MGDGIGFPPQDSWCVGVLGGTWRIFCCFVYKLDTPHLVVYLLSGPSSSDHAEYEQDRLLDGSFAFIYHHWLNRSKRCFILTRTQVRYDELWLCLKLGYAGVAASIYHDVSVQFHHSFPIQIQFLSRESSILKVSAILKSMEIHQSTTHEGRPQRQLETIDGHAGLAGYSGYHVRWTDTNSWQGISWTVSDKFWHIWLNVLVHNSNSPTWKWLK